jgi:hypothetical protein
MGYGFAGLRGFGDEEPDYSGLVAENVEIDELEIGGAAFAMHLNCDFEHDGNNWIAREVWIDGIERLKYENEIKIIEARIPIHDDPRFAGIVAAAETWADKNLAPEDYS